MNLWKLRFTKLWYRSFKTKEFFLIKGLLDERRVIKQCTIGSFISRSDHYMLTLGYSFIDLYGQTVLNTVYRRLCNRCLKVAVKGYKQSVKLVESHPSLFCIFFFESLHIFLITFLPLKRKAKKISDGFLLSLRFGLFSYGESVTYISMM